MAKKLLIYNMLFKKRKTENRMTHPETDPTLEQQAPAQDEPKIENVHTSEETPFAKENLELQDQVADLKDKYLRLYAEFDNYKRRNLKENAEARAMAGRDTMSALLPVLDDFGRASKNETFSEGMSLLHQKLQSTLRNKGLREMESNGTAFDPELHEAVTEIPAPTEELKGKIIDTLESGYLLNEKIIRHAKVVVGK
jgi:molecular chaperone GrpE